MGLYDSMLDPARSSADIKHCACCDAPFTKDSDSCLCEFNDDGECKTHKEKE